LNAKGNETEIMWRYNIVTLAQLIGNATEQGDPKTVQTTDCKVYFINTFKHKCRNMVPYKERQKQNLNNKYEIFENIFRKK
jgi:hypothetical protein